MHLGAAPVERVHQAIHANVIENQTAK